MSIRSLFWTSSLALALPVLAQSPAMTPVTLGQALQAARNNLDVAQARGAVAAAQSDVAAADHAPLPTLSSKLSSMDLQNGLGGGNLWSQKRIDKSIGIDWTWERGNKRELRTQSAKQAADAARDDLADVTLQQLLAAHAAFFDLLAAQERLVQITALERSAAQLSDVAQRRVQAGDLSAQEGARTRIEAERARADMLGAQLDRQRAALVLRQLTGLNVPVDRLQARAEWATLHDVDTTEPDFASLAAARPEVRAAQARAQAAQAALDAATALKQSDVTWGASLDHYPGTSTRLLELRLQMPLQWGYSYQGEIGRAQAQLTQAQNAYDKALLVAGNDLQRLHLEAQSSAQRAHGYLSDILPAARKVVEGAELAYHKGALSLSDLLDARRTLRATLIEALTARADAAKAQGAWQLRTQPDLLLTSNLPTESSK